MLLPVEVETVRTSARRSTEDESPLQIPIFVAKPKEDTPERRPVLLLFQEAFGVNSHIQDVCRRYARLGYIVVSPDMYYRTGEWKTFAYNEFPATATAREVLTEEAVLGDIRAVLNFIKTMDNADSSRVGVLGYCLGGRLTFVTACAFSDEIRVAAVYYGGGLTVSSPQFPVPPVQKSGNIKVPMALFFGGLDKGIPKHAVEEIEQALTEANVEHQIYFYPEADHGFFCNERPTFDPAAAQDAWHHTVQLFKRHLA